MGAVLEGFRWCFPILLFLPVFCIYARWQLLLVVRMNIYIYDIALFAVMAAIAFSCFAGWPVFDARTAHFSSVPTRSPCPAVF